MDVESGRIVRCHASESALALNPRCAALQIQGLRECLDIPALQGSCLAT